MAPSAPSAPAAPAADSADAGPAASGMTIRPARPSLITSPGRSRSAISPTWPTVSRPRRAPATIVRDDLSGLPAADPAGPSGRRRSAPAARRPERAAERRGHRCPAVREIGDAADVAAHAPRDGRPGRRRDDPDDRDRPCSPPRTGARRARRRAARRSPAPRRPRPAAGRRRRRPGRPRRCRRRARTRTGRAAPRAPHRAAARASSARTSGRSGGCPARPASGLAMMLRARSWATDGSRPASAARWASSAASPGRRPRSCTFPREVRSRWPSPKSRARPARARQRGPVTYPPGSRMRATCPSLAGCRASRPGQASDAGGGGTQPPSGHRQGGTDPRGGALDSSTRAAPGRAT